MMPALHLSHFASIRSMANVDFERRMNERQCTITPSSQRNSYAYTQEPLCLSAELLDPRVVNDRACLERYGLTLEQ